MIGLRTKREVEYPSPNLGDLRELLNYQIKSLPSKEISNPMMNEILRLCELLKIAIQAKQASQEK